MLKSIRNSLLLTLAISLASTVGIAQTGAQKAFATIKSATGTWEAKSPDGRPFEVTFKTISRGSAVISEILAPTEDMVSVFALDGPDRLLLTHYCAVGNAPRMQATISSDGKSIAFSYVSATNLATPDAGHMEKMVLTMLDENHHTEEWTFVDHGKEHREVFDLRRKI